MAVGSHRQAGIWAILVAVLAFVAAIFLHLFRFTIDGTSATVSQWNEPCTSTLGQAGQALGASVRSRCGEVSLARHATAWLVVLSAVLVLVGVTLIRRAARTSESAPQSVVGPLRPRRPLRDQPVSAVRGRRPALAIRRSASLLLLQSPPGLNRRTLTKRTVAPIQSRDAYSPVYRAAARPRRPPPAMAGHCPGCRVDGQGRVILGRYAASSAWSLPGGVIDPAEQPADAAVRECYGETGI